MANRAPSIWVKWVCLQYVGCSLLCALTGAFLESWECIALPFVCSTVMGACPLPHVFVRGTSSFAPCLCSALLFTEEGGLHLTSARNHTSLSWPSYTCTENVSSLVASTTCSKHAHCHYHLSISKWLPDRASSDQSEIETNTWLTLGPQQYTRVPFDIYTGRYSLDKPLTG